jgi:hypothetical protein
VFLVIFETVAMHLICMVVLLGWAILSSVVRRWIRICSMMFVRLCLFRLFGSLADGADVCWYMNRLIC